MRVNQRLVDDFLEELKGLPSETSWAKLGAFLVNIEESAYLAAMEKVNEPSIGERTKETEAFLASHKSVTLPKKNPCEEALTTVDFLPGREADDARHLAHAVALFLTFRSLGREEEAGKLAAALLSLDYEIRSRKGTKPATLRLVSELSGLSFPIGLLEENAVGYLFEHGERKKIHRLYKKHMLSAPSLIRALEGRPGGLETLRLLASDAPEEGYEDDCAVLLESAGDLALMKKQAKENPAIFSELAPFFHLRGLEYRDLADFYLPVAGGNLEKAYECAVVDYPDEPSYRLAFFKCRLDPFSFVLLEESDQREVNSSICEKDWATAFRYQSSYVLDIDSLPTKSIVSFSAFIGGRLDAFVREEGVIASPVWARMLNRSYQRFAFSKEDRIAFLDAFLDELSCRGRDMDSSRLGELASILAEMADNLDLKEEIYQMSAKRLGKTHCFLRLLKEALT